MPVQRDRSRVHEARVAGLAISLSVAALILVVVYVVGGFGFTSLPSFPEGASMGAITDTWTALGIAFNNVQVGATNSTNIHADEDLTCGRYWIGKLQ